MFSHPWSTENVLTSILHSNSSQLEVAFRNCMSKFENVCCVIESEDTILLRTESWMKTRNFSPASLSLVIFVWSQQDLWNKIHSFETILIPLLPQKSLKSLLKESSKRSSINFLKLANLHIFSPPCWAIYEIVRTM
jgi:hypothetical protein